MSTAGLTAVLLIRVALGDRSDDPALLSGLTLDIAGVDAKTHAVDVLGDSRLYDALRARGLSPTIERDFESAPFASPVDEYMSPAEVSAKLDALAAAYPAVAKKIVYAVSAQGRPVYGLKISDNVDLTEDEPAIFFVAQHHAREVMTPEIAIDIADQLLTGYGADPKIAGWVNTRQIFVLPVHNPDGSDYVFDRDRSWRKNRRDNGDRTFGVDLNRNYPFHWGACGGSSGDKGSDGYRGPSPASEPETAGIMALALTHRPIISLSYHSYGEQVLIPYGCGGVHSAEKAVFRRLSSDIASRLLSDDGSHLYQPGAVWEVLYAEDGETNAWMHGVNGTYAFEIEANDSSQGFQPHFVPWRDSTVTRQRPAWRYVLDRIDGSGISGHVTDACTGAPLAATVGLDEIVFGNGEPPRAAEPVFGRFQWLTTPGSFHLRAGKPGYVEQVWPLAVELARVPRPVRLVPVGSSAVAVAQIALTESAGDFDGEADPGESLRLSLQAINTGGAAVTGVTATLSTSDPFVTIVDGDAAFGSIAAGAVAPGDGFALAVAPGAPDEHAAVLHVTFAGTPLLCSPDEEVTLRITRGRAGCSVEEGLDANPGWTIVNSTSGGWAFGPPAGNGGANGPASAFTGTNVYGTNLSGSYANNADYQLLTTAYDLSKLRHGVLSYRRWLDNEPGFDVASVDASSDAGATWQPLSSAFGYGEGWERDAIDIAAVADGKPSVRFRFRLRSDVVDVRSGFYIDDLQICGENLTKPPNGVGGSVRLAPAGSDLHVSWDAAPVDAAHDPATLYNVYRALAPGNGYAGAASSQVTSVVLAGEMVTGTTAFFLVAGGNAGGSSSDAPAP